MASVVSPNMIPATIDSIGNPGTAGITSGVVVLEVEGGVTVIVLTWLEDSDVELETLLDVSLDEVLDVCIVDDVASLLVEEVLVEVVSEEVELVIEVVSVVVTGVVTVVPGGGLPSGGSKWNEKLRVPAPSEVCPTASPFVLDLMYREKIAPVLGAGIAISGGV